MVNSENQKASGINFTVHKLRHTFATLMFEDGCDIYSLAKMMGHSDIRTTTIYLSASAEHLRAQITNIHLIIVISETEAWYNFHTMQHGLLIQVDIRFECDIHVRPILQRGID